MKKKERGRVDQEVRGKEGHNVREAERSVEGPWGRYKVRENRKTSVGEGVMQ